MRKALLIGIGVLFTIIIVAFYDATPEVEDNDEEIISIHNLVEIPPLPPMDNYGFVMEGIDVVDDRIRRDESLYIILRRHNVSPQTIYAIQQETRGVVNLNRFIPGQRYRVYKSGDDAFAFVWRQSLTKYVTIKWNSDNVVSLESGTVAIEHREAQTANIISTSLYDAVRGEGASQRLGVELADIFGWEVDFFALRRGDHFKVIYDNLYADDEYIGIGDIKAAEFQHRNRTHRAYFFDNGERRGYFDENGNSLQKQLLKAPFRYNQRVSSGFSRNRFHPILQQNRPHYGTDYAAPTGTPVIAVGDGVVTEAARRGGNGNIVQIRHNNTYKTAYLHLNGFASGIRAGVRVEQGQVIGYVGQTGLATGPHLCYRMYVDDRPVNSVTVDLPASESLDDEYLPKLMEIVKEMDRRLELLRLEEEEDNLAFN